GWLIENVRLTRFVARVLVVVALGVAGVLSPTAALAVSTSPRSTPLFNGRLYLGGRCDEVDGEWRHNLAAFTLSDGALDGNWQPSADDTVRALVAAGSRVYLGGSFHLVNDVKGTLR